MLKNDRKQYQSEKISDKIEFCRTRNKIVNTELNIQLYTIYKREYITSPTSIWYELLHGLYLFYLTIYDRIIFQINLYI